MTTRITTNPVFISYPIESLHNGSLQESSAFGTPPDASSSTKAFQKQSPNATSYAGDRSSNYLRKLSKTLQTRSLPLAGSLPQKARRKSLPALIFSKGPTVKGTAVVGFQADAPKGNSRQFPQSRSLKSHSFSHNSDRQRTVSEPSLTGRNTESAYFYSSIREESSE